MTFQKKQLLCLALGSSVLSLGACSYNHPNAMPSGYTYHHEDYKSPISPDSQKISIEQRKYMDAAQAEQFRDAVYDLLERLTMRAGMPPKPVFIMAPDPMTTFYANIDNDLRESMRHIGYAISDTPDGAYIFTYEAQEIPAPAVETAQANNVHLTLRVFDSLGENARQLTEESGQYFIQGADLINIAPSKYNVLPTQDTINTRQIAAPEVSIQNPVIPEPMMVDPMMDQQMMEPVMEPMVESYVPDMPMPETPMMEPVMDAPRASIMDAPSMGVSVPTADLPSAVERPAMVKPSVSNSVSMPSKKPSHNDIVIINRGDKASMGLTSDAKMPTMADSMNDMSEAIMGSGDALQDAIPDTEKAVRGRVSNPSNY